MVNQKRENNVGDRVKITDAIQALGYTMNDFRKMTVSEIMDHIQEYRYLINR